MPDKSAQGRPSDYSLSELTARTSVSASAAPVAIKLSLSGHGAVWNSNAESSGMSPNSSTPGVLVGRGDGAESG